ncbi:zinc finger protein PLAGL1-like [Varroa destructor]|uniref:C2H2-type domain-containing protein n=2 Tax=Varroa TaxID=62624 RepID=A0A7M7K9D5_VARDE|nr:zinc finger protein PLAGL1-like [Varroa destructor]
MYGNSNTPSDVVPSGPLTAATPQGLQMLVATKGLQISAGLDGPSSWPCAYCTVVVGSRSALNRHIANIHSPYRTTFTCHLCNAAVSRKDHLWRHIRRKHPDSLPADMAGSSSMPADLMRVAGMISPPPTSGGSSPPHAIISALSTIPTSLVVTPSPPSTVP